MKRQIIVAVAFVAVVLPSVAIAQTAKVAAVEDSPLVAAAKRAKAARKSGMVITNETLAHVAGSAHMTTTSTQASLPKAPASVMPVPEFAPTVAEVAKAAAAVAAAVKDTAKATPHEDPVEDAEGTPEELAIDAHECPTCLPILAPVPPNLPLRPMEPSTNPPRVVPPQPMDGKKP